MWTVSKLASSAKEWLRSSEKQIKQNINHENPTEDGTTTRQPNKRKADEPIIDASAPTIAPLPVALASLNPSPTTTATIRPKRLRSTTEQPKSAPTKQQRAPVLTPGGGFLRGTPETAQLGTLNVFKFKDPTALHRRRRTDSLSGLLSHIDDSNNNNNTPIHDGNTKNKNTLDLQRDHQLSSTTTPSTIPTDTNPNQRRRSRLAPTPLRSTGARPRLLDIVTTNANILHTEITGRKRKGDDFLVVEAQQQREVHTNEEDHAKKMKSSSIIAANFGIKSIDSTSNGVPQTTTLASHDIVSPPPITTTTTTTTTKEEVEPQPQQGFAFTFGASTVTAPIDHDHAATTVPPQKEEKPQPSSIPPLPQQPSPAANQPVFTFGAAPSVPAIPRDEQQPFQALSNPSLHRASPPSSLPPSLEPQQQIGAFAFGQQTQSTSTTTSGRRIVRTRRRR